MFIPNFDKHAWRAFAHGFLKGLAAPVRLYSTESLPRIRVDLVRPTIAESATEALRSDWRRIGLDLQGVIDNAPPQQSTVIRQAAVQSLRVGSSTVC